MVPKNDNKVVDPHSLPRLLYVGDVPIQAASGGSILLYRLLQNYPASRLRVVESNLSLPHSQNRLPEVTYDRIYLGPTRPLYTRFRDLYSLILYQVAELHAFRLNKIVKQFRPDAILTVPWGYSWRTAATVARQHKLPLQLIVHDHTPLYYDQFPQFIQQKIIADFKQVYQQAQSCFCVSPYMKQQYQAEFEKSSTVLYPIQPLDTPVYEHPPEEKTESNRQLRVAYAGSVDSPAYARCLTALAEALRTINGQLVIFSSASINLDADNINAHPFIPYKELLPTLRAEADALFVPMSFEPNEKLNMSIAFPTKIADYTMTGLPLLIYGPSYCSAVQWAKENPGVAEIATKTDGSDLIPAVQKLADPHYRHELGCQGLKIGRSYFSHNSVTGKYYQAIQAVSTS
ncbi:MAG: glycosyltransferase [Chloroflexota bacterium]